MLHSTIFTNRFGRSLKCALGAPGSACFAISKIDGLGPGMASVNIHDIATLDGGYFGSARFSSRNIVIQGTFLDYDENWNYVPIEKTRHMIYSFFQPKTPIQMVIEADERTVMIVGCIETCDPTIFDQNTGVQISILCPGYYFKMADLEERVQNIRIYTDGLFEFPFSNESLTRKMIEFGSADTLIEKEVYYDGDAENGLVINIEFNGEPVTGQIIIANTPLGNTDIGNVGFDDQDDYNYLNWSDSGLVENYITINIAELQSRLSSRYQGSIYANGNRIVIRTDAGNKTVKFIDSDNTEYNILGYLPHLEWLKIYPGYNKFVVQTDAASVGHFDITASFEVLYTGI